MAVTKAAPQAAGACFVLALVCGLPSLAQAQCLASTHEVKFADGSARTKDYVCKLAGAPQPQIRIEFDRLSEAAAGTLLEGEPYPELDRLLGKTRVLQNAVQTEAKGLFDRFGTRSLDHNCFRFTVAVGAGGRDYDQKDQKKQPCGERTLWYLTFPDQEDLTTIQMPLPDDLDYVQQKTDWPPGYSFFYTKCAQKSLIGCTLIWRPARQVDLKDYDKNRKIFEERLKLTMPPAPPGMPAPEAPGAGASESDKSAEKYFSLVDYLARDGWAEDFLTITGEAGEDTCGGMDFSLHVRQLVLDVAIVENIAKETLSLEGFLGSAVGQGPLRKNELASAGAETIGISRLTLAPGERVAVALRISFVPAASVEKLFKDQTAARATYSRIMAMPKGTIIRQKPGDPGDAPPLKKVRESFGPPTLPSLAPYVYGPELAIRGLVVNSQQLDFESSARNFMRLTAGEGYGSCPYLYAFEGGRWIKRGKVLHQANGQDNEGTQRIALAGLVSRYRLSEEELEAASIDRVRLELELIDGTHLMLHPTDQRLLDADERRATILAWETLDLDFDLPAHVAPAQVARSTLEITGYYRPYSRMLIGQR
jgi:hypothetical protein